jgi:death-on-curing protein
MPMTLPPSTRNAPSRTLAPVRARGAPPGHRKLVVMIPDHTIAAIMILTSKKILDIHKLVISNFGGIDGVLCQGTVDYLVDQINAEPDLFRKAALALHIVANCHPFLDGNKRSAFQIAELILSCEGRAITAEEETIIRMLLRVASYKCLVDDVKIWLLKNTDKLESSHFG